MSVAVKVVEQLRLLWREYGIVREVLILLTHAVDLQTRGESFEVRKVLLEVGKLLDKARP